MKFKKEPLLFQALIWYLHNNKHCCHRVQGMAMKLQSEITLTSSCACLADSYPVGSGRWP